MCQQPDDPGLPAGWIVLDFGLLEGERDAPADQQRVVQILQRRCKTGPFVATEVGVGGAPVATTR